MGAAVTRRNRGLLNAVVAVTFATTTWGVLSRMSFEPRGAVPFLALAVGVLCLASSEAAAALLVVVASVPLLATDALAAFVLLVTGLALAQYLGAGEVPVLALVGAALVGAVLGPVWAVPVLAGYVLGGAAGALASAVACVALEIAALVLGTPSAGGVFVTAAKPLLHFPGVKGSLLTFSWLFPSLRHLSLGSANALLAASTRDGQATMLVLQPAAWALAALVAGKLRRPTGDKRQLLMSSVAVAGGLVIVAAAASVAGNSAGIGLSTSELLATLVTSAAISAAGVVIWDRVFRVLPPPRVQPTESSAGQRSMVEDDADVDELLRLIATAEERIATQHTTDTVVMITDMKSFTRMTEEEGSFVTAKAIQSHRDLLLPVIESHGGQGKSTGGDGLIASFDSPSEALCAAVEMQRTLAAFNTGHTHERDILIRIGVASGEVVLDKGGRPFIGNAVNLSARVMGLGDGGQVLATQAVARTAKPVDLTTVSHGTFELKNIAEPIEVVEVLWHDGQSPCDPRTLGTQAPSPPMPPSET